MTGSAVSDKNRKGISLYLVFLLWSHWSASDNKAESVHLYMALNYRTCHVLLFFCFFSSLSDFIACRCSVETCFSKFNRCLRFLFQWKFELQIASANNTFIIKINYLFVK